MRNFMIVAALAATAAVWAQDVAAGVGALQRQYQGQKNKIIAAAEQMPEDGYTLVPGEGSRTFARVVGHIADAQAGSCGALAGTPTQLNAENGMTAKADLVAALRKSFELCDKAYADTTAENFFAAAQPPFGGPQPRHSMLWGNLTHSEEMYGTMAVYLRIKGSVPPSSAGKGGKGGAKGGKGK